jgi:AhpD family alkylhydroperoxidase
MNEPPIHEESPMTTAAPMTKPADLTLSFPAHDAASAPEPARSHLAQAARTFGFVPAPLARMAEAPSTIDGFEALNTLWGQTSFTALERETVVLTIAVFNGCHYCVAMHSALLARRPQNAALVAALRAGRSPEDARLAALATFTRAVLQGRGLPDAVAEQAFVSAGFGPAQALEVVLGIATYTLSTFVNRLTRAPLDPAFAAFEWTEPGS